MTIDSLFDVSQEVVLITGSSGQLGGEYVKIFLERGANVIGLDVRPSTDSDSLSARYPKRYLFLVWIHLLTIAKRNQPQKDKSI